METKTPIQFNVLDTEMLASIEGGTVSAGEVAQATGICTLAGAMIGSLIAPGAGTWAGGILGAQYCTGIWAIARSL